MTQQYTPVAWQDETTSQQGTLINAERLNQMQTAHHYADGWEEVDAIPTADPGVAYHKVVYCTADSTFYRWDGTEWTKDIDDETKALLQQEIARATAAEGELAQDIADEETRATTAETALGGRITAETSARTQADTALGGRIDAEATAREGADTTLQEHIDTLAQHTEDALDTKVDKDGAVTSVQGHTGAVMLNSAEIPLNAGASTPTVHNAILANQGQIDAVTADLADEVQARTTAVGALSTRVDTLETGLADTYNKAQVDTYLAAKADVATTYTKSETDTLLGAKANDNAVVHLAGAETIPGAKTFSGQVITKGLFRPFIVYGEYTHDANTVYPQRVRPITIFPSQNSTANPIGRIESVEEANRIGLELSSTNYDTGDSNWMTLWTDKTNGAKYTAIPNLPSTTSANMVPNLNYISQTGDGAPNNLLHITGDETKNGKLTIQGAGLWQQRFIIKTTAVNQASPSSSTIYGQAVTWTDVNDVEVARIYIQQLSNGNFELYAAVKDSTNTYKSVKLI